eukprot:6231224-Alexandrium_andersonii.AAC.1
MTQPSTRPQNGQLSGRATVPSPRTPAGAICASDCAADSRAASSCAAPAVPYGWYPAHTGRGVPAGWPGGAAGGGCGAGCGAD